MDGKSGTFIYDENCTLCKMLAAYLSRDLGGSIFFSSWQDFRTTESASQYFTQDQREMTTPDKIRLLTSNGMLEAEDVWSWLLNHHPNLKSLNWLAIKLNLHEQTAKSLNSASHLLRRLCAWCKPW